jgi:hypothetical protein
MVQKAEVAMTRLTRFAGVIAGALLLGVITVRTTRAQLAPADAFCRRALGHGVKQLTDIALKVQTHCHSDRIDGEIPPTTACNDVDTLSVAAVDEALMNIAELVAEKCAPPASTAADNGYLICPDPCAANLADYSDVVTCLACVTKNEIASIANDTWGMPDAPAEREVKNCVRLVGRALDNYLGKTMREQQVCQYRKDVRPSTTDCAVDDPRGRVARAGERVERLIARCEPGTLDSFALGSCGAGAGACLTDRAALTAQALFRAVYEPVAPTAIPMDTATVTPTAGPQTPTPSPTPTSCGVLMPSVDPVTSPTDQLEQVITGYGLVTGNRYLGITSEAGEFSGTGYHGNFPVTVTLLPNQVNHLTVCITNQACGTPSSLCTSVDRNGDPLEILQQP